MHRKHNRYAGRNRHLTSNVLFQIEKFIGGTGRIKSIGNVSASLNSNVAFLKSWGYQSSSSAGTSIFLAPLSIDCMDKWNDVDQKRIEFD